jgi:putative transcriptional regulator
VKTVAQRKQLIKLRKEKNLTQKDVADQLGITTGFYGMIETGARNPTLDLAKKIADYFCVSIESIFFKDENNKTLFEKTVYKSTGTG